MLLDPDRNRIGHMVEAAEEALQHARDRAVEDIARDRPVQHLLIRNIEILGEAASRVSEDLRNSHPEIPWRTMIDMRNRLIHAYFDIDINIVVATVNRALPEVLTRLRALLES